MDIEQIERTPQLRLEYKREQCATLQRINRIAAPVAILIIIVVTLLSDPVSWPNMHRAMLIGRIYCFSLLLVVAISSLIDVFKNRAYLFSSFFFLAGALMMAHVSAVLNNDSSTVMGWMWINIIFCGIYPLPLLQTAVVLVLSFVYYFIYYFQLGFVADLNFRMLLVNVGSASLVSLAMKVGISRIREREFHFRKGLEKASSKIAGLNDRLQDENVRLMHELEVARHIQTLVLPQEEEYTGFAELDIACLMIPADEVGGDYFDTIRFSEDGIIAIGDVTDHGLHSGLIMLMVHTALRAASQLEKDDIKALFKIVNNLLFDFRLKTADHRLMTLLILRYEGQGRFRMTGQHESLLVISAAGEV